MDSYEVAGVIRSDPDLTQIRIIGISLFASPEDGAKAMPAGFVGCIEEPVNSGQFAHSVTAFVKGHTGPV
ncbi:MAG: hypothetical protein LAQ69_41775 [Acidobacteriia bacterium]|nr:hypothetical protein [Terriglobia bacterium]